MDKWTKHVKEVQLESKNIIYGFWNLIEDAKKVGINLEVDILNARRIANGFQLSNCQAKYNEINGPVRLTVSPQMCFVSVEKPESNPNARKLIEGFEKMYMKKPSAVYLDKENNLLTAEFWFDMSEDLKKENIESILARQERKEYELLEH